MGMRVGQTHGFGARSDVHEGGGEVGAVSGHGRRWSREAGRLEG